MKGNFFAIEVESKLESIPVISDFIANTLDSFTVSPAIIFKVQLAVDEACTNVIKYAYSGQIGIIKLTCELLDDSLVITIKDKGKPFDPLSIPTPDLEADLEERKIGGLGMFFMKKMMDDVSYEFSPEEGNKLTMRKRLIPEKAN
jgi:serine/threonine-protein kinase RsbW